MSAPLSKELRTKYNVREMVVPASAGHVLVGTDAADVLVMAMLYTAPRLCAGGSSACPQG